MRSSIVKWVSMASLMLAVLFWDFAANYQLVLNLVVCMAAAVVVVQSVQTLAALKQPALLAMPSITGRTPGSQSL